jgi:hypothetical protein
MKRSAKRETEEMDKLVARIPRELLKRAKIRAVQDETTLQEIVALALEAWLKTPAKGGNR